MLRKPNNLDAEAGSFWKRHARRLEVQGLLNESTVDSFTLLCRTHSILTQLNPHDPADKMGIIKYIGLSKIYQALARGFAMNSDKPRAAANIEDKDEFGL